MWQMIPNKEATEYTVSCAQRSFKGENESKMQF